MPSLLFLFAIQTECLNMVYLSEDCTGDFLTLLSMSINTVLIVVRINSCLCDAELNHLSLGFQNR